MTYDCPCRILYALTFPQPAEIPPLCFVFSFRIVRSLYGRQAHVIYGTSSVVWPLPLPIAIVRSGGVWRDDAAHGAPAPHNQ